MFGISGGELFVILLVIVVVVGPQRLPEYTRTVTQWVRQLRVFLDNAKAQIAEEVGPELADINLSDLDPRNYDPRKIVRDALGEDLDAIRKDFENPFKSVAKAARTSSEAAAGAVNEQVNEGISNKSLKQMIDEKAEETRAARSGQGASDEQPDQGAEEDQGEAQVLIASEEEPLPETSESPTGTSAETSTGSEEVFQVPEREVAGDAPEPDLLGEDEAGEQEEQADEAPVAAAATTVVPSSLVEPTEVPTTSLARPVSPREILRAAKAAARTRPEAASVRVDV